MQAGAGHEGKPLMKRLSRPTHLEASTTLG